MNKQQLANKIWESANKMRSKIEANEYKDYILGFIFYKFLSDKEVAYLKKNDWSDEDLPELAEEETQTVEMCKKNLGYFISYENLFSTWISKGKSFDVSNVTDALSAFERLINDTHKKVFEGIFETLQTGLSKLGETSGARTKAISDLLVLIKDIPMDEKQGYDVLGFIYEYLISNFAANAGKKAGEFYTPHEVSLLMSEIVAGHLKDREQIAIYDPTSGSGSLLINIGHSASRYMNKDRIQYFAQELKENTYNLTRMNLVMRGINPSNLFTRNADTLEDDWPIDLDSYPPVLRVDAVVSNPPYSQQWTPDGKESDPRYAEYGLAPKSKADYAFLLHDLYHIKPDGIMTILGFDTVPQPTYKDKDLRTAIVLEKAKANSVAEIFGNSKKEAIYHHWMDEVPMGEALDDDGDSLESIEGELPDAQYDRDEHRKAVVDDIIENWVSQSHNGKFHAMLATSSIPEAIKYYKELKSRNAGLKITAVFDPSDGNNAGSIEKIDGIAEILEDYKNTFGVFFNISSYANFKRDVCARLAHKMPYLAIENEPAKCLDILIVVDQMLTGYDSKWLNVLINRYMIHCFKDIRNLDVVAVEVEKARKPMI